MSSTAAVGQEAEPLPSKHVVDDGGGVAAAAAADMLQPTSANHAGNDTVESSPFFQGPLRTARSSSSANKSVSERLDADLARHHQPTTTSTTSSSSDLVPLQHDFELLRQELRIVIAAAQNYQASQLALDAARTEMVARLAKLSDQSPIEGWVGGGGGGSNASSGSTTTTTTTTTSDDGGESYVSLVCGSASASSNQRKDGSLSSSYNYQDGIVSYCIDWERAVTRRVEQGTAETNQLRKRLTHYEHKVEALRQQVHHLEEKNTNKKGVPDKLRDKLERNETKLEKAWKAHERAAERLCHLLERVTQRGWCEDLAPLVGRSMQWEWERASKARHLGAQLKVVRDSIQTTLVDHESVQEETVSDEEESSATPVVQEEADLASETTTESTGVATEEEPAESFVNIEEESSEPKGAISTVEEEASRQVAVESSENDAQELEQPSEERNNATTFPCQQFPTCFCEGLHKLVFPHPKARVLDEITQGVEEDLSPSSKSPDQNVSGFGDTIEV